MTTINFLDRTVTKNNETIGFKEAGIWKSIQTKEDFLEDFLMNDFDNELFENQELVYVEK